MSADEFHLGAEGRKAYVAIKASCHYSYTHFRRTRI